MKKYMKRSEVWTYGIGLFGIALLTGWMPDYSYTFFNDFAFKGTGIDSARIMNILPYVTGVAGIVGAACELVIGILVDRTRTRWGKIRPWIGFGILPLAVVAMLVFIAPNTNSYLGAVVWMFVIYSLYTAVSCAVESPANCFGACCTPNPSERSDAISIASIFRSVGQSGGLVVLPVVGFIMKAAMGEQQFKTAEGQGLDLMLSTAVCVLGLVLFGMIFFTNNRERVPYTAEKVSLWESLKFVFTNKNLLMVSLTKFTGFGRGVYSTVSIYIAVYMLGSKDLKLGLLLPMGVGTAVGMLIVKKLLKMWDTRKVYIVCCLYGSASLAVLYVVSRVIGFNPDVLMIPFLIINFFVGLQHGNTNLTPNVMIADCVDEIEWKTGKRQEGLCYAGYGFFSKVAAALTKSFGPALVIWSGYVQSQDMNIAYATQTDDTLNKLLLIYTLIPAIFVIGQMLPILFYDLTGKKKEKITKELAERRALAAANGEEA